MAEGGADGLLQRLSGMRVLAGQHRIALSPDGTRVAYATRAAHGEPWPADGFFPTGAGGLAMGCELRVTDTRGGETATPLPLASGRSWRPAWSPDGGALAFYSDAGGAVHLHVWRPGGGAARAYTCAVVRGRGFAGDRPRWSPDGRRIYLPVCPEGLERSFVGDGGPDPGRDGPATVLYSGRAAPAGRVQPDPRALWGADIGGIDLRTGTLRRLCRGMAAAEPHPSPDGAWIAFHTLARQAGPDGGGTCDLYLLPAEGGDALPVAVGLPGNSQRRHEPAWHPGGDALAFIRDGQALVHRIASGRAEAAAEIPDAADDRYLAWTPDGDALLVRGSGGALWRVPAAGGAAVRLGVPDGHRLSRPLQPTGGDVAAVRDGGLLVPAVETATHRARLLLVPLDGSPASVLWEDEAALEWQAFSNTWHWFADATPDGSAVVYARETAQEPPDLWARTAGAPPRRLTELNPGLRTAVRSEVLPFPLPGGQQARGLLWTPGTGGGGPHPTVVVLHPDLAPSAGRHRFAPEVAAGFEPQYLAAHGLAVWMPDIAWPGGPGERGERLAADAAAAVDAVVAVGRADPARLALAGYGLGAYAAHALLVRTDRFRAAVSTAGVVNFTAAHGRLRNWKGTADTSAADQCESLLGSAGGPWAEPLRYVRESPLFALDRVNTPILFIAGRDRAPESEAMFSGLCRLGRDAALARYPEEEGEAPFDWRPAAYADVTRRITNWVLRWMGA